MNHLNLKSSWHFRTIGLGTINYRAGARRLAKEAFSTGLFETSEAFDEKYLKLNSELFWENHRKILKSRTHGFGFYVWKPELIKLALSGIPENHGVMYCDAGNLISGKFDDINVLGSYLNLASESNVVGSNSQNFVEKDWSPLELMDLLNLSQMHRGSSQFLGGFLLITNTPEGRQFVEQWSDLACQENHRFLFPRMATTYPKNLSFDQAILSCLLKSRSKPSVNLGDKVNLGCVRAARHRFAYSIDSKNCIERGFFNLIASLSKFKLALEHRIFRNSLYREPSNHP